MDLFAKMLLSDAIPESQSSPPGLKNPVNHWSLPILLERASYLRKLAAFGDGSATDTLEDHPHHLTMLCFRSRDGAAESHENATVFFHILEGRATLVAGGTISGLKTVATGKMQIVSIEGGTRQELRAGDVVHIPAGVPHQVIVDGEKTLTYLVVKMKETPKSA